MGRLRSFVRAVGMLGVFGLVLVVAVIVIGVTLNNIVQLNEGITEIHDLSSEHTSFQSVQYELIWVQIETRMLMLGDYYPDRGAVEEMYASSQVEVQEWIDELNARPASELTPIAVAQFEYSMDVLGGEFERLASEGFEDQAETIDDLHRLEQPINRDIRDLLFDSNVGIGEKLWEMDQQVASATNLAIGSLVLFPMLALLAFIATSRITQPLLQMDNAILAIKGGRYRRALLKDLFHYGGGMGALARALDELASTTAANEDALKVEIEYLRHEVQETRRRRLVQSSAVYRGELEKEL